jgi:hypothetical protein
MQLGTTVKINEIIEIDYERASIETLTIGSGCSILTYIEMYLKIQKMSKDFTIPARKILPNDSMYEFAEEISKDLASLKSVETRVPQIIKILTELLDYFSD